MLLASLASGVLPVSNLTNLLAASRLSLTNADFLRHLALPSVAACVAGWCAYRAMFPVRACALQDAHVPDRRALSIGLGAIAMFLVLLIAGEAFGLPAWGAALATEVALLGVTRRIPLRHVPVGTVAVAGALAVLATGVVAALPSALATLGAGGARGARTAGPIWPGGVAVIRRALARAGFELRRTKGGGPRRTLTEVLAHLRELGLRLGIVARIERGESGGKWSGGR